MRAIADSAASLAPNRHRIVIEVETLHDLKPFGGRDSRKQVRQTDLRPYGRDARLHSRKRVRQIANRVRTFGFTNPVLIDSQNMILAGHKPDKGPNVAIPSTALCAFHWIRRRGRRAGFKLSQSAL